MNRILHKEALNPFVSRIEVEAPRIAAKAQAGQFVILRAKEDSERIPLTIADFDRNQGVISLIYQLVGASTLQLEQLQEGDALRDLVGPLGRPSELEGLREVAVIGGGVGCAIAYPIAKRLKELGASLTCIVGFRQRGLIILEEAFRAVSDRFQLTTDDGSGGEKGYVTDALDSLLGAGQRFDTVFAIGPLPMMKAVVGVTREHGIKTIVSMNPIMIDGTGMCGCCRLSVGGETRFACVDGPDFDGFAVDFDEAMRRNRFYLEAEAQAREEECRLMNRRIEP